MFRYADIPAGHCSCHPDFANFEKRIESGKDHNSEDKPAVREISRQLVSPWLLLPQGPTPRSRFFLLKKFEYVITCVITKTYERTNYTKNIKNKQTEEMTTLTVTTIGNSLGILLPKEVTQRLEIQKGDKLFLTHGPDGYRITVYDPEFEEQMNLARKIMKNRRNALRQLAK